MIYLSSEKHQNNKRIAKNTLFLYFRMFLMMIISFYTSRLILNTLGVVDFGIYNAVGGVTALLSFVTNSMTEATQRFIIFEQGKIEGNPNRIFCQCVNAHLLCALFFTLLLETVGLYFLNTKMIIPEDRMHAAYWVFHFSVMTTFVSIISVPYTASIIAHEKMSAFAYLSIFEALLKLTLIICINYINADKLILFSFLWLAFTIIIRSVYNLYCRYHFDETKFFLSFDRIIFSKIIKFAFWNLYGNLADMINTQGLNILLNTFFGPVVNAARAIAVQIQGTIRNFCVNFQMAINPQITKKYAEGDIEYMQDLIFKSSKYSFYLLLFLVTPFFVNTGLILHFWLGDVIPEHTTRFVQIILLIMMVNVFTDPLNVSLNATGTIRKPVIIISSVSILTLPLAYFCVLNNLGPESVFYSLLITELLSQICRVVIVFKMINISIIIFIKEVLSKTLSLLLIVTLFIILLKHILGFSVFNSIVILGLTFLFELFFILLFGISVKERTYIVNYIKKKVKGCYPNL